MSGVTQPRVTAAVDAQNPGSAVSWSRCLGNRPVRAVSARRGRYRGGLAP
jgi:hypothetical protein